eukprot:311497-Chlamydomonas_euryale.AAC.2
MLLHLLFRKRHRAWVGQLLEQAAGRGAVGARGGKGCCWRERRRKELLAQVAGKGAVGASGGERSYWRKRREKDLLAQAAGRGAVGANGGKGSCWHKQGESSQAGGGGRGGTARLAVRAPPAS